MKKAPLFITVGILAVLALGYFLYDYFLSYQGLRPWDVVPESAVAVYEPSSCRDCIDPVKNSPIWSIISKAIFYQKGLDTTQQVAKLLTDPMPNSLASLHVTKKDDFGFVLYIPFDSPTEKEIFEGILEQWKSDEGIRFVERLYNGVTIKELTINQSMVLSWVMLEDMFVGSFTPFLVEDVIRTYSGATSTTFKKEVAQVFEMNRVNNDAGNIYVNLQNLYDWISVFIPSVQLDVLRNFGMASLLDIKSQQGGIILNGFSVEGNDNAVLSIFSGQSPAAFGIKHFVSNRTVFMELFGINDGSDFGKRLKQYSGRPTMLNDTVSQLAMNLHVNFDGLYASISNEIGLCYVEAGGKDLSKILIIETNVPEEWSKQLEAISSQLSMDTVFFEKYSDYEIREVPIYRVVEKLFSPLIKGFDNTYYTILGNIIVAGEDLEHLKAFLEDIDKENTWGKSVDKNKFLESTLLESNVSLYINTPRIWNILSGVLNEKWRKFIQENRVALNATGMGSIQFSHLNNSFYTNLSFLYKEEGPRTGQVQVSEEVVVSNFAHHVTGRPFVVQNHVDKSFETFIQDSIGRVHLVSSKGEELWSLQMNGPIIGAVHQVDYFKNGKLQLFYATPGKLHIIDRLGNYVSPFPLNIKTDEIEFADLVDYDHSKNYRFLITEKSGKLWMYDKMGVNLEGWRPQDAGNELFTKASHHRVRGHDYIIAIRRDGKVHMTNRRGELIPGFQLDLEARPNGDYFLEVGTNAQNTHFVVVSREGNRVKFNLEGKVHTREPLLKSSINANFSLVREHFGKSYIMVRQESKGITLLDMDGKEILTNKYMGLNEVDVNYYDFGAGRVYYVITDSIQELTYIYDHSGNLITSPPLESYAVALHMANNDKVYLYLTYRNALYVKTLE